MRTIHQTAWVIVLVWMSVETLADSDDDAVIAYRTYVMAIRDGKVDIALQHVEPVLGPLKLLVRSVLEAKEAIETLKKEAVARFGPMPNGDGSLLKEGVLPDTYLQGLRGQADPAQADLMMLIGKNPADGREFMAGVMVKKDGEWRVSAGMLTDTMPNNDAPNPPNDEEMAFKMKYQGAIKAAADSVTGKIKSGELKDHSQVAKAISDEFARLRK